MHIARYDTSIDRKSCRTSQIDVFTDRRDKVREFLGDGAACAWEISCGHRSDISTICECDSGNLIHGILKRLVAGDEVSFGIDLDERSYAVTGGNTHQTLGRDTTSLLGSR